jgi:hypothetical protein
MHNPDVRKRVTKNQGRKINEKSGIDRGGQWGAERSTGGGAVGNWNEAKVSNKGPKTEEKGAKRLPTWKPKRHKDYNKDTLRTGSQNGAKGNEKVTKTEARAAQGW